MQAGSARQSKTPIQAYKGKTTWARLLQAAGVCLKNAPCFKIQNTAGQKCQEKLVKIKLQFKLGKSISRNFCPFLFLKKKCFPSKHYTIWIIKKHKKKENFVKLIHIISQVFDPLWNFKLLRQGICRAVRKNLSHETYQCMQEKKHKIKIYYNNLWLWDLHTML